MGDLKDRGSTASLRACLILIALVLGGTSVCTSQTNSLPAMGWEPWYIDHCGNSSSWDEGYYRRVADFMVSSGLKELGYTWLTIECGDHSRDKDGQIQPNPAKFPRGFNPIADYIHQRGLKVRAYSDAGYGKCCCFEGAGSRGHYQDDLRRWIGFGFDGAKIDWCGGHDEKLDPQTQFLQFAHQIKETGKPFPLEICTWGEGNPWEWGKDVGGFWRTGGDIDGGQPAANHGDWHLLMKNLDANRHPGPDHVGPGEGWNYPDVLLVGLAGGLNETEEQTQFGMWAMMASPLFLGNDLFNTPPYAWKILKNREVIAIDQDPLGMQGDVVKEYDEGNLQVWAKQLQDGSRAVALLNREDKPQRITVFWSDLGVSGRWKVRDLWNHADKGVFDGRYSRTVPSHGTALLKLSQ